MATGENRTTDSTTRNENSDEELERHASEVVAQSSQDEDESGEKAYAAPSQQTGGKATATSKSIPVPEDEEQSTSRQVSTGEDETSPDRRNSFNRLSRRGRKRKHASLKKKGKRSRRSPSSSSSSSDCSSSSSSSSVTSSSDGSSSEEHRRRKKKSKRKARKAKTLVRKLNRRFKPKKKNSKRSWKAPKDLSAWANLQIHME